MTVLCAISRLYPSSDWRNHIILSGFPVSSHGSENQVFCHIKIEVNYFIMNFGVS